MKQKIFLIILFAAWLFAVIAVLTGCNVTKHIVKTTSDSSAVTHSDSSIAIAMETTGHEDNNSVDSGSVSVEFYPEKDTSNNEGNVTPENPKDDELFIHKTDSGISIINHTGNAIKFVKVKDSKSNKTIKDTSTKKSAISDVKVAAIVTVQKAAENLDKKTGVSVWFFVKLGAIIAVIGFIVWKCYSTGLNPWALLLLVAKQVKRRLIG